MDQSSNFKSAFIAFIGRPNAGKSTLLNTILEEELAIVSALPQTTRQKMNGIYNADNLQIVFVDTPGIHKGKHSINKSMYKMSADMLFDEGIDIICYLVDISRELGEEEDLIVDLFRKAKQKKCIIFNKADICQDLGLAVGRFYNRYPDLQDVSAVNMAAPDKRAKQVFLDFVTPMIEEGPCFFSPEDITDANMRFFAAEFIRKQIIHNTKNEIPHASFVEIESYKEVDSVHHISALIHVETTGQKAIVVGKEGAVIKKIRTFARKEIKKLAGEQVKLEIEVKVSPRWRDNKGFLNSFGIDTP